MAQQLLRGPQGVCYVAILRQKDSFFAKPLVATLLSFRQGFLLLCSFSFCVLFPFVFFFRAMLGQPDFTPTSLKDLVSTSGKFLWLLRASEEGSLSPIAELDTRLSEAVERLMRRYDEGLLGHRPLERHLPLVMSGEVVPPLEFLQMCIGQGHLPEDILDYLLV